MPSFDDWLLDNSVHMVVEWIVGAIIVLGTTALTRSYVRQGRVHIGTNEGRTCQSPQVLVVGLLCGSIALACLVWGIVDPSTLQGPGAALASLASSRLLVILLLRADRALSSPTVKELLEPSPERAGRSAS